MTTATSAVPYRVEHTGRNVTTVRMDVNCTTGWEQWFLLRSDAHHDNPKCDWALERKHLDQAVDKRAGVLDFGDTLCLMQGKYDKRASKSAVRPEHQVDDYLDAVVRTAADFYEPYAHNWIVLARGNHECSVRKRLETDCTDRLVATLNDRTGSHILAGGYTGWVRFHFKNHTYSTSRVLWYTHGTGGGGPVTQDTISAQRQRSYIENADFIVSGHTHDAWAQENAKIRLNSAGTVERLKMWNIKCPTYKDDYGDGFSGWHVDTGKPPKPLGAWWLRFYWDGSRRVQAQIIRAD